MIHFEVRQNPKTKKFTLAVKHSNGRILLSSTSQGYNRKRDAEQVINHVGLFGMMARDRYFKEKKKPHAPARGKTHG